MFERVPLNEVSIVAIKSLYRFRRKESLACQPLRPGEWHAWKCPEGSGLYAIYIANETDTEVTTADIDLLSNVSV